MSSNNNDAASAETNNVRNVRQRVNPSGLESLPDAPLANIASYLSHTTRALFSSALTAPSSSYDLGGHNENEKDIMAKKIKQFAKESGWEPANNNSLSDMLSSAIAAGQLKKINNNPQHQKLSKASKIVLSNPYHKINEKYTSSDFRHITYNQDWKTLDLLDLDKSLRMRLTDGDIAGILVCIDAVNNLENIRLPHCINVRGDGLAPLRGSIVLKRVDLCIVSEEVDSMTPTLSFDALLPIFESIMAKNQNLLRSFHMPKVWHDKLSIRLNDFLVEMYIPQTCGYERYELMSKSEKSEMRAKYLLQYQPPMNTCKMACTECARSHRPCGTMRSNQLCLTFEGGDTLKNCPSCERKYCCENDDDHAGLQIKKCAVCKEAGCRECNCDLYNCECCDRDLCEGCVERVNCSRCYDGIGESNCADCAANGQGYNNECGQCRQIFCTECEPNTDGENVCQACLG